MPNHDRFANGAVFTESFLQLLIKIPVARYHIIAAHMIERPIYYLLTDGIVGFVEATLEGDRIFFFFFWVTFVLCLYISPPYMNTLSLVNENQCNVHEEERLFA